MLNSLEQRAVLAGALWSLVIAVPAAILSTLLDDDEMGSDPSNWILVAAAMIVIAYLVGGAQAGRRAREAPFVNGAAAVVAAWAVVQVAFIVVNVAQGDGVSIVRFVFNALLAASIGTVGAWFGSRRPRQPTDPPTPA